VAWHREAKAEIPEPEINAFLTHLAAEEGRHHRDESLYGMEAAESKRLVVDR